MLGSPLATSEGAIDVVTNIRNKIKSTVKGKTGGVYIRHFWEVLDSSSGRELSIEPFDTLYICPSHGLPSWTEWFPGWTRLTVSYGSRSENEKGNKPVSSQSCDVSAITMRKSTFQKKNLQSFGPESFFIYFWECLLQVGWQYLLQNISLQHPIGVTKLAFEDGDVQSWAHFASRGRNDDSFTCATGLFYSYLMPGLPLVSPVKTLKSFSVASSESESGRHKTNILINKQTISSESTVTTVTSGISNKPI